MKRITLITLLSLIVLGVTAPMSIAQNLPPHVAGKIAAVSHEKVKVKEHWMDQVKVKVDSCTQPGQLQEVIYNPGRISDRTALGHLFEANIHQAHQALMNKPQPQRQMNGFGIFWIDQNNHVLRSGFLGNNVDCGAVPALLQQF